MTDIRKKNWRERKSVVSVLLIVMFVIILASLIVIWKLKSFTAEKSCTTKECVESAFTYLESLDPEIEPCDNFYNFTCGKYKGDFVVKHVQETLNREMKDLIISNIKDNESRSVKLQKKYYQTCMNLTAVEEDDNESLKELFKTIGGWPILIGKNWSDINFNWSNIVEKCQEYGLYYDWFINIDGSGYDNVLEVSPPSNVHYVKTDQSQKYTEFMVNVVLKLGASGNVSKLFGEMNQVTLFESELYRIIEESRENESHYIREEIEAKYPYVPWFILLKNVILAKHDKIKFTAGSYLSKLEVLLRKTQKSIQANYIFWKLAESFSLFLTHDIRREYQDYASFSRNYTYPTDRKEYCFDITRTVFAYVSEAQYVRKYASEVSLIKEMVNKIKLALRNRLKNANWMTSSDKSLAFFKLERMRVIIGGPEEMYDENEFDRFLGLDQIDIVDSKSVVETILQVDRIRDRYNLDFVRPKITFDQAILYQATTNLSLTRYQRDENIMFLPAALFGSPFYSENRPNYLNYGALGTIIGHELSHGFGINGNVVYENEKMKIIWTNHTHENFLSNAQCLLNNCNDIGINNDLSMNCETTFEESFADYVGINLAYEAYMTVQKEFGEEKILPGLTYTPTQLFWIAYASIMCSNEDLKSSDTFTHLLPFQRITGAYRNTDYFAEDFNCPAGSNMNPIEKCRIL